MSKEVLHFVRITDHDCRVWCAGQSPQCSSYRSSGHWALSGLCRPCRQPGHLARKCRQAWARLSLLLLPVHVDDPENASDATSMPEEKEDVAQAAPPSSPLYPASANVADPVPVSPVAVRGSRSYCFCFCF